MQSAGAREGGGGEGGRGGPAVSLAQVVSVVKGTDVWKVDQLRRKLRYSGCLCFTAIDRHANDIATVFVGGLFPILVRWLEFEVTLLSFVESSVGLITKLTFFSHAQITSYD